MGFSPRMALMFRIEKRVCSAEFTKQLFPDCGRGFIMFRDRSRWESFVLGGVIMDMEALFSSFLGVALTSLLIPWEGKLSILRECVALNGLCLSSGLVDWEILLSMSSTGL